jgi:hypothetical protein
MELILNTKKTSHTQNHPASNWLLLGDLELSVEVNSRDTLDARLKEILNPLDLHTDFQTRILNSAHQTIVRILQTDTQTKLDHIHLLVFAPSNRTPKKQTWGYFSVERLEDTKEGAVANNHTIEIYLYKEGDAILTHEKAS